MWGTVVVGERGDYYAISLTGTEWGYLIALYLLCLVIRAIVILGEICLQSRSSISPGALLPLPLPLPHPYLYP